MARRRKHAEHENHERWLVSYADFITLLFAFFVVMYSVSSVNEGRYRVLSEALVSAFRAPAQSLAPVQVGRPAKQASQTPVELSPLAMDRRVNPRQHAAGRRGGDRARGDRSAGPRGRDGPVGGRAGLARVADDVLQALAPLIESDLVRVRRGATFVEIELRSEVLYDSGRADLRPEALPVLEQLSVVLTRVVNPIRVEGYTDTQPIRSAAYRSNWELSAARAGGVVHFLSGNGVGEQRLALVGYGEHRPAAPNDAEQGRARNRRVVIVVLAGAPEEAPDTAAADPDPDPESGAVAVDADAAQAPVQPESDPEPARPARWPADRGITLPGHAGFALPIPMPGGNR